MIIKAAATTLKGERSGGLSQDGLKYFPSWGPARMKNFLN